MSGRSKIYLTIAACTGAALVFFFTIQIYLATRRVVNVTHSQLRQMISIELPPRATRATVKGFLDRKGWGHSDEGTKTFALVRDAEHSFLLQANTQIQFQFDAEDRMVSYSFEDFLTGP